ncbi:hypothetical protein [Spiroplasma endosymbiont of Danaus chrysippus]|uniref:hypothetical protein n=1 Tax=Spiroplasma endosymbiont of Danaus chrysippus TaxID=2691041 RepID=UPI00157AAF0F|nr:hypothetical protein [Spiroplasma endosymbiont of Danaus chrysippus]
MDFKEIIKYVLYIGGFCLILWFCRNWIHEGIQKFKHKKYVKEKENDPDCTFCRKDFEKKKRKLEMEKQQKELEKGGD